MTSTNRLVKNKNSFFFFFKLFIQELKAIIVIYKSKTVKNDLTIFPLSGIKKANFKTTINLNNVKFYKKKLK